MLTFAQISDFHISEPGARATNYYQTTKHLKIAVDHLNKLPEEPKFVICTGDLTDLGKYGEYVILKDILDGLSMPYYLIPGNHDKYDAMRQVFSKQFYLMGHDGFIQYTIEKWEVRLIGLDTLIPGELSGRLCQKRLRWLHQRLEEQPERPTIIFMHHPPFQTGMRSMDKIGLENSDGLADALTPYNNIDAILAGHMHRYINCRFGNTIAMTAPSTAHQIALNLTDQNSISIIMEPPAGLIHRWLGNQKGLVSHISYTGGGYDEIPLDHPGSPPNPAINLFQ